MKRIGILRDTFNPVHNGHLLLSRAARKQYNLDEVWFLPERIPSQMSRLAVLSDENRVETVKMAVKNEENSIATDFELLQNDYTLPDLFKLLFEENKNCSFFLLLTKEALESFLKTSEIEEVLSILPILFESENNENVDDLCSINELRLTAENVRIFPVHTDKASITSFYLRSCLINGDDEKGKEFLNKEVYAFIKEKRLFHKLTYAELDQEMRRILPQKRYYHSVGVSHIAAAYAAAYHVDVEKALIAGLLHDCAKPLSDEELVLECEKRGMSVNETERRNGFLLHGKLGASFLTEKYFITDSDIINAVYAHCEGKVSMNLYEKIIYISDYVEPFRTHKTTPPLAEIRSIAFSDIDYALFLVLKNTIRYLKETNSEIEETILKAFDSCKEQCFQNHREVENE